MTISIRPVRLEDQEAIWEILSPVVSQGECFAWPRDLSREDALAIWDSPGGEVFLAELDGQIVGTYYIHRNHLGGGSHVANCGYATAESARGKGVARAMGEHSIERGRQIGYRAIQFNFVVSSNAPAIKLWISLGFEIVGTLPGAFEHPSLGYVDAYVMFRNL